MGRVSIPARGTFRRRAVNTSGSDIYLPGKLSLLIFIISLEIPSAKATHLHAKSILNCTRDIRVREEAHAGSHDAFLHSRFLWRGLYVRKGLSEVEVSPWI